MPGEELAVAVTGRNRGVSMRRSKNWAGFRSVRCPIDFSEHSRLALRYAAAVALRGNVTLTVEYANDPLLIAAAGAALHDRHLARRSAQELQEFVDATLASSVRNRLRVKSHVSIGDPAAQIVKAAARDRTDLIVLGTHGLTGADRLLMGSTTLSVLQSRSHSCGAGGTTARCARRAGTEAREQRRAGGVRRCRRRDCGARRHRARGPRDHRSA